MMCVSPNHPKKNINAFGRITRTMEAIDLTFAILPLAWLSFG